MTLQSGIYAVVRTGGGRAGAALQRVDLAASQLGRSGKTITFTLEFPAR